MLALCMDEDKPKFRPLPKLDMTIWVFIGGFYASRWFVYKTLYMLFSKFTGMTKNFLDCLLFSSPERKAQGELIVWDLSRRNKDKLHFN